MLSSRISLIKLVALVLSLASIIIFTIGLIANSNPEDPYLSQTGQLKSSDLLQHYGAGRFYSQSHTNKLYREAALGKWIHTIKKDPTLSPSQISFNYVYPPLVAWTASWLSGLAYNQFIMTWLVLNLFLYFLSIQNLTKLSDFKTNPFFTTILMLGLPSFFFTLILGQNAILTFFILIIATNLLKSSKPFIAGLVVSCLFYKPQFFPIIGCFMLFSGHYRFCGGLILGSMGWFILGLLLCGWTLYLDWFHVIQTMLSGTHPQVTTLNQSFKEFLLEIFNLHESSLFSPFFSFVSLLLTASLALFIRFSSFKTKMWHPYYDLLASLGLWTILSPYVMHYDLLVGAGWTFLFLVHYYKTISGALLGGLFWVISLLAINIGNFQPSPCAPLLILWFAGTLYLLLRGNTHQNDNTLGAIKL